MEEAHIITHSVQKKERSPIMTKNVHFVGLDIACDDFAASIYQSPKQSIITKEGIKNTFE